MEDSLIAVPGGEVFVRRWGAARNDREPIVLLHDSLGCVDMWHGFPQDLAERTGRTVIAYDRLGFGRSSPRVGLPGTGFIQEEAEIHFPALARALSLDGYVLFGHSVGGGMALSIASRHPDACRAVISESAQAFVEPRTLAGIEAAKASFADPMRLARLGKWHGDKARWVLDAWTEVWLSAEFGSWRLVPVLAGIGCPVLVIHGSEDEYGSEAFPTTIARHVRGPVQVELLDGCGHVPHRERTAPVLDLVSTFIQRHNGAGA